MKTRYIPAFIMLIAGAIVCIISLVNSYSAQKTLETVLITLIIFYIIGLIARKLYRAILINFRPEKEEETTDELQEQDVVEEQEAYEEKTEENSNIATEK